MTISIATHNPSYDTNNLQKSAGIMEAQAENRKKALISNTPISANIHSPYGDVAELNPLHLLARGPANNSSSIATSEEASQFTADLSERMQKNGGLALMAHARHVSGKIASLL